MVMATDYVKLITDRKEGDFICEFRHLYMDAWSLPAIRWKAISGYVEPTFPNHGWAE